MVLKRTVNKDLVKTSSETSKFLLSPVPIILSLLVIVIIYYANSWKSEQKIYDIVISGIKISDYNQIKNIAEDLALNKPKKEFDANALINTISNLPYIHRVHLNLSYSGQLSILVEERDIVAILYSNDGKQYFLSTDGLILPYKSIKTDDYLPIVSGIYKVEDKADIIVILNILDELEKNPGKWFLPSIKQINYSSLNQSIELELLNNTKVIIGSPDDLNEKLRKLAIYLNYRQNRAIAKFIDLRWSDIIIES